MGRNEDIDNAYARIASERDYVFSLSLEQFAALDIAQKIASAEWQIQMANEQLARLRPAAAKLPKPDPEKIASAEWQIQMANEQLARLRPAAAKLPKPDPEKVESVDPHIVTEGLYKFRGKRKIQEELYGYPASEDY
jgi:hypothetical protein